MEIATDVIENPKNFHIRLGHIAQNTLGHMTYRLVYQLCKKNTFFSLILKSASFLQDECMEMLLKLQRFTASSMQGIMCRHPVLSLQDSDRPLENLSIGKHLWLFVRQKFIHRRR
jgi:hypothetical protein